MMRFDQRYSRKTRHGMISEDLARTVYGPRPSPKPFMEAAMTVRKCLISAS
jgi:hypothetical protein